MGTVFWCDKCGNKYFNEEEGCSCNSKSWWRISTRQIDSDAGYKTISANTFAEHNGVSPENIKVLAYLAKQVSLETGTPTYRMDVTECKQKQGSDGSWDEEHFGCVDEYCADNGLDIDNITNRS